MFQMSFQQNRSKKEVFFILFFCLWIRLPGESANLEGETVVTTRTEVSLH